jgi:glycosyltransferase involved in cell wall biosynthesis
MPPEIFAADTPASKRFAVPKVSVIIPAYNAATTLGRALASVAGQTMPDWEAVVVDDCSTDGTWVELQRWMAAEPRVRGLRLGWNEKAAAARNHALAAARGEWIAIVDADDWIAPDRLETLLTLAEASGYDVVTDNLLMFDALAHAVVGTALPVSGGVFPMDLKGFLANCMTGVSRFDYGMLKPVVRRAFLDRTGVRYEPGCFNGHDFHFMLDLLAAGAKAAVLSEPRYVYVQPFGAVSRRHSHEGRTRYRYDVMSHYNERAIGRYRTRLDPAALRLLYRRGEAIARFAAYLSVKESLAERALARAAASFIRRPDCLLPALAALLARTGLARRIHRLPAGTLDIMSWAADPAGNSPQPVPPGAGRGAGGREWGKREVGGISVVWIKRQVRKLLPDPVLEIRAHWKVHGRFPNIFNPVTFNDKVLHRRLFDHRPVLRQIADKAAVRSYVEARLGPQILPELYCLTSDPASIPFGRLPDSFVVKPTHGSGWVRVVTDKSDLDRAALIETCADWMQRSYYRETLERIYKDIEPRIIVEEFIHDGSGAVPNDYKFYVFDGRVQLVQVHAGRFTDHRISLYTPAWEKVDARLEYEAIDGDLPRPPHLAEMIEAAQCLGSGLDFIRADFYDTGRRVYFGELTPNPSGGHQYFRPLEFDRTLGGFWKLHSRSQRRSGAAALRAPGCG